MACLGAANLQGDAFSRRWLTIKGSASLAGVAALPHGYGRGSGCDR